MWLTCGVCKGYYKGGGGRVRSATCPQCKFKKKQTARDAMEKKRTYKSEEVTRDLRGNVVSEVRGIELQCGFCGEDVIVRNKKQKFCHPCLNERYKLFPNRGAVARDCHGCGNKFWKRSRSKQTWCDDVCKANIRAFNHCVFCGDDIPIEAPITRKFCGTSCKRHWPLVERMRAERDGITKGRTYTDKMMYDILRKKGAGLDLLHEFQVKE